jgi:hypothetical protein
MVSIYTPYGMQSVIHMDVPYGSHHTSAPDTPDGIQMEMPYGFYMDSMWLPDDESIWYPDLNRMNTVGPADIIGQRTYNKTKRCLH